MNNFWGSKNLSAAGRLVHCAPILAAVLVGAIASSSFAACDLPANPAVTTQPTTGQQYDFFSNYGNYMPRMHCLQTAEGRPDWLWISVLIGLNFIVVSGYLRIFHFWRGCYLNEQPRDRDAKLMNLAWVFALCAVCGYGLSIMIFFWPVYRLLAIAMVGLAYITWRFAFDLEPFRNSFTAHRLQRQLTESLKREKHELEDKNHQLEQAHDRLEKAKLELEKTNEDLDEFVYAASHDLKSPLRAISSLSQFVAEDLGEDANEQVVEDLDKMQSRVKRMERMLDGLLHYSRVGRIQYEPETFTVAEAIEQAVAVLHVPPEFEIRWDSSPLQSTSPKPLLEQVVRNLVDNAVKHHPRKDGSVQIKVEQQGQLLDISISDDGDGIPPEFQERIFNMFQTLRRRDELDSNGMGLALVKRIVERQGGTISVESIADRGSTFRFTWPSVESVKPESAQPESLQPGPHVSFSPAHEEERCHV